MSHKPHFILRLEAGKPQKLVVFGTSLSFHVAPILRLALQNRFGERAQIINSGLPAKASRTGLNALEEKVLAHLPDALLLEWAVNDAHSYFHEPEALDAGITREESRLNLERLIERTKEALLNCEILLWTTNPTFDAPDSTARAGSARAQLDGFYEGVREVASARGLTLIDAEKFWNSLRLQDENLFRSLVPDGVHPTPKALREHLIPFVEREWGLPFEKP